MLNLYVIHPLRLRNAEFVPILHFSVFFCRQAGEFGPFSRYLPVEKLDGTFDILTYPRYEELKKQKAIVGKKYVVQTDAEIQAAKDAVAKEAAAKEAEAKEAAAREAAAREATAKAAELETEGAEAPAPSKDAQERALPATAPS